jgi:serine/threonine protein kinase
MSAILQLSQELLSRCDGSLPQQKVERCSKMTSLWAGYGAVYHLIVKENGKSATRSLILKDVRPPKDSGVSHDRKIHSYKVETAFYQQLAVPLKQCGLSIATPYLAEHNLDGSTGTGSMHLILSDLREEYPNQHRPMDLAHAKAALYWLATLHASHWQRPIPEKLWGQGCFWQLDTRLEELENIEPEWRDLQRAAHHISKQLADEKFQTLCHGDFKGANILFSSSGGGKAPKAAAYDFQYCGGGDAMKDVAYLFCSALESKTLQLHEEELLQYYHEELCKQLPREAAEAYTVEIMKERLNLAICDFVRFMAGWGWWGNTSWASRKCRDHLKNLQL